MLRRPCFALSALTTLALISVLTSGVRAQQQQPPTNVNALKATEQGQTGWTDLFNGKDLSGWTAAGLSWTVDGGILRNTRGRDQDSLVSNTEVPAGSFAFEIKVCVLDGTRLRVHLAPGLYVGNEGGIRQFEIYGGDLAHVRCVSDQTYVPGQWYDLLVRVDADGQISLSKNGKITHTGVLTKQEPIRVSITPGDGYSEGHIEVSAVRLQAGTAGLNQVKQPSAQAPTTILDNFAQSPLSGLWVTQRNGGQIVKQDDGLAFLPASAQDNFPFMATRPGAFPAGASWKVAIRFRYPFRGPYGIAFGFRQPASPEKHVCSIHTDSSLKVLHLFLGGTLVDIPNPEAWHTLTVENNHGNWTASVDGQQTLSAAIGQTDYELWFGKESGSFRPWSWTTLCLQSVYIEYTDGPRPDWLASLPKSPPVEVGERTQTIPPAGPQVASPQPVSKASRLTDIAAIFGTNSSTTPPVLPATDGHLIVTARDSKVQAPAGTSVEFDPSNNRPDFEPIEIYVFLNGRLLQKRDTIPGHPLPAFMVDVPAIAYARISIVAEDSSEQKEELQSCILNGRAASSDPAASFNLKDEEVKLICSSQAPAKAYYVFAENQYVGCLKNSSYTFAVSGNTLPAGQYKFEVITEDAEGFLHPSSENTITIQPRYTLSSYAQQGVFHVEGDKHSIPVRIVRQPGTSIVKSRVYVAGLYVGESKDADFQMQVPLDDVPSGTASIEVVGITKDGSSYPPEAIQVQLQNYRLNYQAARGQMDKDLQAKIAQLGQLDQEIVYWYVKGNHEPAFVTAVESHTITNVLASDAIAIAGSTTYLHSITVPGPASDDFGKCAAAIMKKAQVHLEIGKLYKALGRFDSARAQFEQVVFEVGEDSGVGSAAMEELRHL